MTTSPVPLFLNPVAGRGRAAKRSERIVELLQSSGIEANLNLSSGVGDLERRVRASCLDGAERIVVAGGDGSIHEAVNGIMSAGTATPLGVIPSGTGNDFAKACSITLDWQEAARALAGRLRAGAPMRRIDIGRMNDRYFANGAGIGFDAKVTRVARSFRLPIGDLVYLIAIFRCMADGIATPDVRISAPGFEWSGPLTLASVSNGAWIGGMFHIAPMARNDDGRLELLVAAPVSRLRIVSLLPRLIRGGHLEQPEISHASVRELRIETAAPVPSHLDGEVGDENTVYEFELLPAALRLL